MAIIDDYAETRALPERATARIAGVRVTATRGGLWRVCGGDGQVRGHVRVEGEGDARRYVATRYVPRAAAFRDLGAFWVAEEAVECVVRSR